MQVLITVLVNGGATTYMLRRWDLFDSTYTAGGARSPPPQRLQVLVPSGNRDDDDHQDGYQNGAKISTTGSYAVSSCPANADSSQGLWLLRRTAAASRSKSGVLPRGICCPVSAMGLHTAQAPLIEIHRCHKSSQCVHVAEAKALRLISIQWFSSVRRSFVCVCRNVIESIHDFQRQGGLNKQLEHLDKVFSSYLIAPGNTGEDAEYVQAVGDDPTRDHDVDEQ